MTPTFYSPPFAPQDLPPLSPDVLEACRTLADDLALQASALADLLPAYRLLSTALAEPGQKSGQPLVVGISGAQGSGKTTMTRFLSLLLERVHELRVCSFSIDDFYLDRERRLQLARTVHPMLETRGVPGTHDVELGLAVMRRLAAAGPGDVVEIPRFDKAIDDRLPRPEWIRFLGPPDVILFEGWCVGARPQSDDELEPAINERESVEDEDRTWRRFVNERLRGPYAEWFECLDVLVFLQVPNFEDVRRWRGLQEEKLARRNPNAPGVMASDELDRFLALYERTTRHALRSLPALADVVCRIDSSHGIAGIRVGRMDPGGPG